MVLIVLPPEYPVATQSSSILPPAAGIVNSVGLLTVILPVGSPYWRIEQLEVSVPSVTEITPDLFVVLFFRIESVITFPDKLAVHQSSVEETVKVPLPV